MLPVRLLAPPKPHIVWKPIPFGPKRKAEMAAYMGKTSGGLARPMFRGLARLRFKFTLTMASYNLIRIPKLLAAATITAMLARTQ